VTTAELRRPEAVDAAWPGEQPPLPRTADEQRVPRIPVEECGDPLVDVSDEVLVVPAYAAMGVPRSSDRLRLRGGVLTRLVAAGKSLPAGYGIALLDGWRPLHFQVALLEYYRSRHDVDLDGYVADPEDLTVVPPHVTGGAVDVTLTYHGQLLALGTGFDDFSPRAHLAALEPQPCTSMDRALRRTLAFAMDSAGFAPYALEWWHWSFGDQRWAAAVGARAALYGPAEAVG
jgi:D-alanyl-D-alanine dipeptidase